MEQKTQPFWSKNTKSCISDLQTTANGLTTNEVKKRLNSYGANSLKPQKRSGTFMLLIGQFKSPIILILIAATALSLFLHNFVDASLFSASS